MLRITNLSVLQSAIFMLIMAFVVARSSLGQVPVGTDFTYQGKLTDGNSPPASLDADIKFRLYDAAAGGNLIGSELLATGITLASDGTFTVDLDFGEEFLGDERWLEIHVRSPIGDPADLTGYTALDPRQPVMPTPYALFALNAPSAWSGSTGNVSTLDKVGIGTASPLTELHVTSADPIGVFDGHLRLEGTSTTGGSLTGAGISFTGHDGTQQRHWAHIRGLKANDTVGDTDSVLTFWTRQNGGTFSERLRIDENGNVGIGTDSPVGTLHVEGDIRSTGNTGGKVTWFNPNNQSASAFLGWKDDVARIRIGGIGAGSVGGFDFQRIGDQSIMRLLDNGNVGIGTTNPTSPLTVDGVIESLTGGIKFPDGTTMTTAAGTSSPWLVTGSDIYYNAGNVGVGTSDFTYGKIVLQQPHDLDGSVGLTVMHPGGVPALRAWMDSVNRTRLGAGFTGDFPLILNESGGHVGVGTLSPTSPLTVNGVIESLSGGIKFPDGTTMTSADTGALWSQSGSDVYYDSGSVGIGTTSPAAKLSVEAETASSGNNTAVFSAPNLGPNASNIHHGTTGNWYIRSADSAGKVILQDTGGNVGIATSSPDVRLHVFNGSDVTEAGGGIIQLGSSTGSNMGLDNNEIMARNNGVVATLSLNAEGGDVKVGENSGGTSTLYTPVLTITGGSDLSEQFDVASDDIEPKPGMVVTIDPLNPGKLVVSSQSYDRTVAGIISGAGGVKTGMMMGQQDSVADGEYPVALTGRVYVNCDTSNGSIQPGDLLTTSSTLGYAMKVTDFSRAHGAIIGKAMTTLDRDSGLVLVLVSLQ